MLQSMTGFGSARLDTDQYCISVEIRSLNSKSMDLSVRLPRFLSDKEYEVRNMMQKGLVRGKVSVSVDYVKNKAQKAKSTINKELLQTYYRELNDAADAVGGSKNDLFRLALHMPDVLLQDQVEDEVDQQQQRNIADQLDVRERDSAPEATASRPSSVVVTPQNFWRKSGFMGGTGTCSSGRAPRSESTKRGGAQ